MPKPTKEQLAYWKEHVEKSKGTALMVPEKFTELVDRMEEMRAEYNAKLVQMAEEEIGLNVTTQNVFFDIRKFLSANGYKDIWIKEVGLDANALAQGVYVLNLTEQMR